MATYMYYPYSNGVMTANAGLMHHNSATIGNIHAVNSYDYPSMIPMVNHQHQRESGYNFQPGHRHSNSYILPPPGLPYMQPVPPLPATGAPQSMMMNPSQQSVFQPPSIVQPNEQNVNGGVCEVLDYDLKVMTEFVRKNACLSFGTFGISSSALDLFCSSISSVLSSTRLPSTTIFMALDYLIKYLDLIECDFQTIGGKSIEVIYQNLVIAFILANKFNDDKTFTNKSWAQAAGMDLTLINNLERKWLSVIQWKLFEGKFEIYSSFLESYRIFEREHNLTSYQNQISPSPSPHPLKFPSASAMAYGYQTPTSGNISMTYSSPCYSDYRNDNYDSYYNNQFYISPTPQFMTTPLKPNTTSYYEKPQTSFWNEKNPSHSNRNYYCFSTTY